ncbi:EamA family transporter [Actinophytocola glycyrrhizae]|uniref:EamA family transporter n=1 Tax=Actinophytocola glycyrrhizae TaxID=2044873 RepID=A0ABV9S5H6_9PSEU
MGALLALASAVAYGVADYVGGVLSRRAHFGNVAFVGQVGGLVLALAVAPFVPAHVSPQGLAWGALSGVGTGFGMLFLYRGISRGAMSVVVPVSAVGGVAIPVVVGVALLGDRPSALAWAGIAVAVPALWLVAHTSGPAKPDGVTDALLASVGIAVQYLALAQSDAGLWAVVAGRVAAALVVLPAVRGPVTAVVPAAACGATAAVALTCYLLATWQQLVTVAVVLSSLYPVIPVLLGITLLRERLARAQIAGLVAGAAATGLLVVG